MFQMFCWPQGAWITKIHNLMILRSFCGRVKLSQRIMTSVTPQLSLNRTADAPKNRHEGMLKLNLITTDQLHQCLDNPLHWIKVTLETLSDGSRAEKPWRTWSGIRSILIGPHSSHYIKLIIHACTEAEDTMGRGREEEGEGREERIVWGGGDRVVVLTLQTPKQWERENIREKKEMRKCHKFEFSTDLLPKTHTVSTSRSQHCFLNTAHETPGKLSLTPKASETQSAPPFSNPPPSVLTLLASPRNHPELLLQDKKHTANIKSDNSPNSPCSPSLLYSLFLSHSLPLSITAPAGEAGLLLPWPRPQPCHVTAIPSGQEGISAAPPLIQRKWMENIVDAGDYLEPRETLWRKRCVCVWRITGKWYGDIHTFFVKVCLPLRLRKTRDDILSTSLSWCVSICPLLFRVCRLSLSSLLSYKQSPISISTNHLLICDRCHNSTHPCGCPRWGPKNVAFSFHAGPT